MGRAASSYLTGIKRYAAAALWNRLDPLLHGYYHDVSLKDQRYALSTIAAVQALDPQAAQSYPIGAWILIQNDRVEDGMAMMRRGVDANPRSGVVVASYSQYLSIYGDDDDLAEAVRFGELALDPSMEWADHTEQINSYAAIVHVFIEGGREDLLEFAEAEIEYLESVPDDSEGSMAHDHDGDGVPDH